MGTPGASSSAKLVRRATLEEGYGMRLAIHPDGHRWAAANHGAVTLYRDLERTAQTEAPFATDRIRFSDDGHRLLAAPYAYDLGHGRWEDLPLVDSQKLAAGLTKRPRGAFGVVNAAWSGDGRELLVYAEYRPPRGKETGAAWQGPTQRLLLLDGKTRAIRAVLREGHEGWGHSMALAVGRRVIAASGEQLDLWDRATHAHLGTLDRLAGVTRDLALSDDDRWLAIVTSDHRAALWDVEGRRAVAQWVAHDDDALATALAPAKRLVATGGNDGMVKLWSFSGQLLAVEPLGRPVEGLAFGAADRLIAAHSGPGERLVVFDVALDKSGP
ncbi:MAG TPA: hypothetical protein VH877_24045 [Polyangia bacterium]|jgi:WD40 repeat protein|nr:hypothetical protein [Polyangia bacterium]